MPADSSWNTPVVSPEARSSNVFGSSSGMLSRSTATPRCSLDQVHGLAQDREVGQAQEVELEQAQRLDAVHLVLGHERVGVGRLLERHQLGQRLARDHDAGRVGGRVAGDALELLREPDQLADLRVAVVHLLELRAERPAPRRA